MVVNVLFIPSVALCVFFFLNGNYTEKIKASIDELDNSKYDYLVIGNSITSHPINEYWWGEWGMAASKKENDFVHILGNLINGSGGA